MTGLANILNIVGLSLGFIASLILAFSLNKLIVALLLALTAHDATIQTSLGRGDVVLFQGLEVHLEKGGRSARFRTGLGLGLLALSFALQLAAVLVPPSSGQG